MGALVTFQHALMSSDEYYEHFHSLRFPCGCVVLSQRRDLRNSPLGPAFYLLEAKCRVSPASPFRHGPMRSPFYRRPDYSQEIFPRSGVGGTVVV